MRFSQRARLFNEVEGQWVPDGAGDAELFHKSVKGCRGSSLSTTHNSSSFAVTSSVWLRAAK